MAAQAAGSTASPTERLLDFSQPLDVNLLDQAVEAFNTGAAPPEVQQMLVQFQQHPQAWTRVDNILTKSQSPKTKMIALNILQVVIKTKWRVLPAAQREGIKKFIVNIIIQHSKEKKNLQTLGALLNKLNITLVQILKQEWPHNWPNFIPELVNSSRQSESLCANNMNILMLLSEEIFDYSAETMTSHKAQELKSTLNREFTQIYQLCEYILDKSQDQTLLSITLKTLQRFLNWIPVGFIFETKLIETLAVKFFPVSVFQNHTLLCLAQIGGLQLTDKPAYNPKFMQMFGQVIQYTGQKLLPPQVDVAAAYRGGDHNVQTFIRYLTIFISSFLKAHLSLVENGPQPVRDVLASSLMFLLRCSQVDDSVVFQVCLEYWNILVAELFKSQRQQPMGGAVPALMLGQMKPTGNARLQLYAPVLSRLRLVIISKMAKPEEIIIVEDECGNIVRERLKDTDSVILYKSMRECLVFLTHLDTQDTQNSMLMKLSKQVDGSEWSWNNLNTLCWAIGSISGAMTENTEKSFLVRVIKDLLGMCERKRGKDNKAVIASNIMYVVGQYPRFLRMHWKFLKTVVNKLFEFMHELHPGVQEMSCETLLKIAKKCRRKFVVTQAQEMRPFIEDILENLPEIIQDLEKNQIHVFYEAVALIIESEADPEARQKLVVKLMTMPNQAWSKIVTEANRSMESLWQPNTVKTLAWVMTVNIKVAQSLKGGYVVQLGRIYLEMLHVYKLYSGFITNQIKSAPAQMRGSAIVRNMRAVKRGIINLLREYARSCPSSEYGTFLSNFLPALLEPVLDDYGRGIPDSREPEVLALFTEIIGKFGSGILPQIGRVFAATFSCTLDMIKLNFSDYPEHRLHFFKMLRAINQNAFRSLLMLNPQQFQLVMDSIVWAFKHIERNVAEEGLSTLYELLQNMQTSDVANNFYRKYFISLLQDLLGVLTDTFHKPGFRLHSQILARMFSIVETGAITVPLWEGTGTQFPNNQHFVRHFTCNLLSTAFKNLSAQQVQTFVSGLFRLNNNLPEFKTLLRDFLVQIKEFGEDNTDLYAEEAAAKKEAELAQERARVAAVPGLQYEPPRSSAGVEMIPTKDVM